MKPVINVVRGGTHCGHDHKTVRAATHCRRQHLRQHEGEPITLQAFALDDRGRYVKVNGNMVAA